MYIGIDWWARYIFFLNSHNLVSTKNAFYLLQNTFCAVSNPSIHLYNVSNYRPNLLQYFTSFIKPFSYSNELIKSNRIMLAGTPGIILLCADRNR